MIRSVDLAAGFDWPDERTVVGRIFPFGEQARIVEPGPDGELEDYIEEFLPGCTTRMRQAASAKGGPSWVRFTFDHESTFDHRAGFCQHLDEQEDGVHAAFQLYDGHDLPKFQSMLRTSHTGLSIEFIDIAAPVVEGNLRRRRQIHIQAVTATPIPAYTSAQVLAVRESGDPLDVGTPNLDAVRAMLADVP